MSHSRYGPVAVLFHWIIAAALLALALSGWWMTRAIDDPDQRDAAAGVYQLHKSLGLTVLVLSLLRLGWRILHPPPPLPSAMAPWERFLARSAHAAFYALLILLPLTGWIYVSAGWAVVDDRPLNVATIWFGVVEAPHLPALSEASEVVRRTAAFQALGAHNALAWGGVLLTGLHVAAALKHHFVDRDGVFASMAPWPLRGVPAAGRVERHRAAAAVGGAGVLALAAAAAVLASPDAPAPAAAPAASPPPGPQAREEPIVPGRAAAWSVAPESSSIVFSGTHAGAGFEGAFEAWTAHIWFDPADLEGSRAVVLIETGSARTAEPMRERTLAEPEWFDPERFPTARFDAGRFRALGGDRYEALGTLRLKGRETPVTLGFTLSIDGPQARVIGRAQLRRSDLDLGMASDPAAEWVSDDVDLRIDLTARRKEPG